jgi:hypothetical protein
LGAGKPYPNEVDERFEDWLEAECLLRQGKVPEAQSLFGRFVAAERGSEGTRALMAALALKKLGNQVEADQRFKSWSESEKDKNVVEWARHVFAGEPGAWTGPLPSNLELRVLIEALAGS